MTQGELGYIVKLCLKRQNQPNKTNKKTEMGWPDHCPPVPETELTIVCLTPSLSKCRPSDSLVSEVSV